MSNVNLFNGCKITVESNNKKYHTYDDWGLYITNTDYIGEPEQYTNYITVPGRDGQIDMSEALTGRPIYIKRDLTIKLAGAKEKKSWDSVISHFRNSINGRICQITFDNDISYFWRGRVHIDDFESAMTLGQFTLNVNAEPYKYSINSSSEPWLWDPFNFETDMITYVGAYDIDGTETVTISAGTMPVCPTFMVNDLVGTLTVTQNNVSYTLASGTNIVPEIIIGGDRDVSLTFNGKAKVQIVYRSGSL